MKIELKTEEGEGVWEGRGEERTYCKDGEKGRSEGKAQSQEGVGSSRTVEAEMGVRGPRDGQVRGQQQKG